MFIIAIIAAAIVSAIATAVIARRPVRNSDKPSSAAPVAAPVAAPCCSKVVVPSEAEADLINININVGKVEAVLNDDNSTYTWRSAAGIAAAASLAAHEVRAALAHMIGVGTVRRSANGKDVYALTSEVGSSYRGRSSSY